MLHIQTTPGGLLLNLVGRTDVATGQRLIEDTLHNGAALACFEKMLVHQCVEPQLAANLCLGVNVMATAKHITQLLAQSSGTNLASATFLPSLFKKLSTNATVRLLGITS